MMKRMKTICASVMLMAMLVVMLIPFSANAKEKRVYDDGVLFTADVHNEIEMAIGELREKTGQDIVVVTTYDAKGKSAMEYADDFYDENGFGTGADKSGVLLLLDMDNREIWISTSGHMIDVLTDERIERILDDVFVGMKEQNYKLAVDAFLEDVDDYIEQGVPAGQHREEMKVPMSTGKKVALGGVLGVLVGGVISGISTLTVMVRYKGGRGQGEYAYREEGRLNLETKNDVFLHQYVSKRRIPKNNSSSGGSSGRSSTHTSSSGSTHGGGGRSF